MSLGIYIQVPFCQTKCTYCNFHTGVVARERYQPYANAVCQEIAETRELNGETVNTIYVGGGTPSLLSPAALGRMLDALREKYRVEAGAETTLEADPETIHQEKAAAWLAAGFNRISMGVQSFHDNELRASGRMHRREDIFRATETLRVAGLQNISMDLIAGLPHQTRESWEASITELLAIRPEHVSIYLLEIDEGSRLGRESLANGTRYSAAAIPSDDAQAEFYESACARLAAAGYEHYEISNWALPGKRSRHNVKYWRREPYLGFGAGAHSFDGAKRWANVHDSTRYVEIITSGASTHEQVECVTSEQALDEEIFLGLRQLEGIDLDAIAARLDIEFSRRETTLRQAIRRLEAEGFVETVGSRVRLAPSRLTVSNEVFVELLNS
ncbi:MAG TPA: radical SAM family heme chaperone HemW [Candidatus Acidoferrales bacterium]|nr:radical SAM family heme chaperone HemW [Candidatus Acidoferrales bacterium]